MCRFIMLFYLDASSIASAIGHVLDLHEARDAKRLDGGV